MFTQNSRYKFNCIGHGLNIDSGVFEPSSTTHDPPPIEIPSKMWQLKVTFVLALALLGSEAKPSHHFDHHQDYHLDHQFNHWEPLPEHVDYASPLLQLQESFVAAPAPPAPLWPAPAAVAPAPLLPAPAPAPLWPAPAPLHTHLLPAPAPLLPAAVPCLPPAAPHAHLLPTQELHLPTVTQLLPPVLEALPFASSYRAIPGPKTTSHRVSLGYAFPKLLAAPPHAHLRALPLKLAHHHHHHSLF
ncbi:hypothetical protein ACLKA6_004997 [Drosophila palustris]